MEPAVQGDPATAASASMQVPLTGRLGTHAAA